MDFKVAIKTFSGVVGAFALFVLVLFILSGFGQRPLRIEQGNQRQILHLGNGVDPEELDPQITTGVSESNIINALFEGLVSEEGSDLHIVPGQAERWEVSEDKRVYTFYIRTNAFWSNGDPVTARDFVLSYKRALSRKLGNEYAYMFFYVVNAKKYFEGEITDFDEVGFKALDERTLRITLNYPTPAEFFLSLLPHHSFYPVHISSIEKYGTFDERGNKWTRPGHFVGNGPFTLKEWKVNHVVTVEKNPLYWDANNILLNEINFYPIESLDTEERAFRAGQLHKTYKLPLAKITYYQEQHSPYLHIRPYLGTYFYMFNTTVPALRDIRVRKALTMSIDREAIVNNVTRGGELPAYNFVPPGTAGYTSRHKIKADLQEARRLLAEAGYPNGEGFPELSILYNTLESHKIIAEAIQQMWKQNLNIDVQLENQEWKVYLNSKVQMDYEIVRFGWIGDYVDPTTFLNMWISESGNNNSGWSNAEYDRLIALANRTPDQEQRFEYLQQAEAILLDELPIMPIYFYTTTQLIHPSLKNWTGNVLDRYIYKRVYLDPDWREDM